MLTAFLSVAERGCPCLSDAAQFHPKHELSLPLTAPAVAGTLVPIRDTVCPCVAVLLAHRRWFACLASPVVALSTSGLSSAGLQMQASDFRAMPVSSPPAAWMDEATARCNLLCRIQPFLIARHCSHNCHQCTFSSAAVAAMSLAAELSVFGGLLD
jgi:hypothetical protein